MLISAEKNFLIPQKLLKINVLGVPLNMSLLIKKQYFLMSLYLRSWGTLGLDKYYVCFAEKAEPQKFAWGHGLEKFV